jgi:hypothetical protein
VAEDMAKQVVWSKVEYEQFKLIYDGFCYLMDYKGERDSNYFYEQKKVFENIIKFWPLIERLCIQFAVELKIGPDDFNKIIFGFNRKAIVELYASNRYQDIAVDKILGLEEERLKKAGQSLFHDIMIKLNNLFQSQEPEIQEDYFAQLPRKDEELTNEQAVELLGGGISASTISKWVKTGSLKGNGCKGRQHRVLKSSVLLLKHQREEQKKLKKAMDSMNIEAFKLK